MNRISLAIIVAAAAVSLGGCASGPKYNEVRGMLPALAPANGRIFVYRASILGAAIQPDVRVNEQVVGSAKPKGFFIVDRPAGDYKISSSTEVTRTLSLTLAAGQTRYVRLGVGFGFFVGHIFPELVEPTVGEKELAACSFVGERQKSPPLLGAEQ